MISELAKTNLFKPIEIADNLQLSHRIVIPPLTRARATEDHVPTDLQLEHYDDLTKTPGSLVITEGTFVNLKAAGWPNVPGVWNDRQLKAWRIITDKIHENKGVVSVQLWNLGRQAQIPEITKEGTPFKSASNIYITKEDEETAKKYNNELTGLTKEEIKAYVKEYADVGEKAIKEGGFDILELHSAHGYLFDQFFQTVSNNRTDEYGGSIENRSRFFFEVIDALIERLGGDGRKIACRLSPWTTFAGMAGFFGDPSPYAQFGYIIGEIEKRRKKYGWGYLSIVEPRFSGTDNTETDKIYGDNQWIFDIFGGIVVRAGDYYSYKDRSYIDIITKDVNNNNRTLIAFGRVSTANPDLVEKLRNDWPCNPYDRDTFYTHSNYGYNTYPKYGETITFNKEEEEKRFGKPLA